MALPNLPSPKEFQPYRKVQGDAEKELIRILEKTAIMIQQRILRMRPGIGGVVRASQLKLVLAAIRRLQESMWSDAITPALARQIEASLKAGESAVEALTRVAYASLSEGAAEELIRGLKAAAESGLKSDAARRKRELSERVYKLRALHEGKVEEIIRSGLIAGLSARELAKEAHAYVSPNTKGGASYAAMRLARTEINNAFHERQIEGATRPGVKAVKWNLSGSHKVPDECNIYAAHKPYAPDAVPDKPHPNCFCYLTYVMESPEDFRTALENGAYDDEIARRVRENMAALGQRVGDEKPNPEVGAKSRDVPKNTDIRKAVLSGEKSSEKLSGGKQAETSKVTYNDGTTGVKKYVGDHTGKRQSDAEELVPMLARMMGIKAPQVTRVNENTTVQQFLPGKLASNLLFEGLATQYKQRVAAAANNDQGYLIAILDQLVLNMDRHEGNWMTGEEDGDLTIIDHGLSYTNMRGKTDLTEPKVVRMNDPFSKLITTGSAKDPRYKPKMDIHPGDIDAIEEMLTALKSEFEKRDRLDWWKFSMLQLENIRPHAQGKKRRIA